MLYCSSDIISMKILCVMLQGGLRAVIWTDVFQAGVMLIGILIIVVQVTSIALCYYKRTRTV